jgi:hypothetical protein
MSFISCDNPTIDFPDVQKVTVEDGEVYVKNNEKTFPAPTYIFAQKYQNEDKYAITFRLVPEATSYSFYLKLFNPSQIIRLESFNISIDNHLGSVYFTGEDIKNSTKFLNPYLPYIFGVSATSYKGITSEILWDNPVN